jgi:heme-degrading monooxygenase HmoA
VKEDPMIARTWRGTVAAGNGTGYVGVVGRTGLPDSRATPGNLGFYVMQRPAGDHDEILTISFWESRDAVRAFAGDDIAAAVFYPEDDAWLTSRDLHADHWEVIGAVAQEPSRELERGSAAEASAGRRPSESSKSPGGTVRR